MTAPRGLSSTAARTRLARAGRLRVIQKPVHNVFMPLSIPPFGRHIPPSLSAQSG